jgi:hypothetical protein
MFRYLVDQGLGKQLLAHGGKGVGSDGLAYADRQRTRSAGLALEVAVLVRGADTDGTAGELVSAVPDCGARQACPNFVRKLVKFPRSALETMGGGGAG